VIEVYLPLNQITITTGATAFAYSDGSNSLTFTAASGTPNATYYVSSGTEWLCSAATCSPLTNFTLNIT
jgi:hypothetical protein